MVPNLDAATQRGRVRLLFITEPPEPRKMQNAIIADVAARPWFGVIKVWAMNGERIPINTNPQDNRQHYQMAMCCKPRKALVASGPHPRSQVNVSC